MKHCEKWRDLLVLEYYGELSSRRSRKLHRHLELCPHCLREFTALKQRLDSIPRPSHRDPGEPFWDDFMQGLNRRIDQENSAPVIAMPSHRRHWRMAAAAMFLVVIGGVAGRFLFPPSGRAPSTSVARKGYSMEFQSHLNTMNPLVIDCANTDPADLANSLPLSPTAWNQLILRNRLLKRRAKEQNDTAALALLNEMELILLEISTAGEGDTTRFTQVQEMIRRNRMVMQLDLLRRRENSPKEKRI